MLRFTAILAALLFSAGLIAADKEKGKAGADKEKKEKHEKVESGIGKGKACAAFQVEDVTGPNKGKQLCYV
ncbi:MAG: hypothetical protein HY717_23700 [Planctomycetes bacterium]|nr:hypothetical protein [Planctomycetota bacterium]